MGIDFNPGEAVGGNPPSARGVPSPKRAIKISCRGERLFVLTKRSPYNIHYSNGHYRE